MKVLLNVKVFRKSKWFHTVWSVWIVFDKSHETMKTNSFLVLALNKLNRLMEPIETFVLTEKVIID